MMVENTDLMKNCGELILSTIIYTQYIEPSVLGQDLDFALYQVRETTRKFQLRHRESRHLSILIA